MFVGAFNFITIAPLHLFIGIVLVASKLGSFSSRDNQQCNGWVLSREAGQSLAASGVVLHASCMWFCSLQFIHCKQLAWSSAVCLIWHSAFKLADANQQVCRNYNFSPLSVSNEVMSWSHFSVMKNAIVENWFYPATWWLSAHFSCK